MSALTPDLLREHPQLAVLTTLLSQIAVVETMLAAVHAGGDTTATADLARSLVRVTRILKMQVESYCQLLVVPEAKPAARPPPARGRG
jgi:hypothetical protein